MWTMDLEKLKKDWTNHPCLVRLNCETIDQLAEHLKKCHKTLMSDRGGPYGYLYQLQVQKVRELKDETSRLK